MCLPRLGCGLQGHIFFLKSLVFIADGCLKEKATSKSLSLLALSSTSETDRIMLNRDDQAAQANMACEVLRVFILSNGCIVVTVTLMACCREEPAEKIEAKAAQSVLRADKAFNMCVQDPRCESKLGQRLERPAKPKVCSRCWAAALRWAELYSHTKVSHLWQQDEWVEKLLCEELCGSSVRH